MSPDKLTTLLTDLGAAAEVIEAIEDSSLQRRRGWDLAGWQYDLVPWGVRFRFQGREPAEVVAVMTVDGSPARPNHGGHFATVLRVG